jgi:hypothetical protein
MQAEQAENLKLLRSHLDMDSLADRLVTKYAEADGQNVETALDSVLEARLAEVRDAIEHASNKLA